MEYEILIDDMEDKINAAQTVIDDAVRSKNMLENEIAWYSNFDCNGEKQNCSCLEKKSKELYEKKKQYNSELYTVAEQLKKTKSHLMSKLSFQYWFNKDQINLRNELNKLSERKTKLEKEIQELEKKLYDNEELIRAGRTNIQKYLTFDLKQMNRYKAELENDIIEKKKAVAPLEELYQNLMEKIAHLVDEIEEKNNELLECQDKIDIANRFDERLNYANNSYERAMIHEECKRVLKDSSPRSVLKRLSSKEKALNHNIEKLDKRICVEINKSQKIITYIVIDGNNLCYNSMNEFIGLGPLIATANKLSQKYEVLVCFDAGITRMLHLNESGIRKQFNDKVDIHITSSKREADYTILEIAENKKCSCVISNDRFADFPDKKVKKENMIFTHEIVGGQVFIYDLDFTVSY